MKSNAYSNKNVNSYFWRTYDQKEIDYVEEYSGKIYGYEMKFSEKQKFKVPKGFMETYNADVIKIDRTNYWKFFELVL